MEKLNQIEAMLKVETNSTPSLIKLNAKKSSSSSLSTATITQKNSINNNQKAMKKSVSNHRIYHGSFDNSKQQTISEIYSGQNRILLSELNDIPFVRREYNSTSQVIKLKAFFII